MNSKERGERSENQEPTTKNTPVADREQPYSAWFDLMIQRNYNGKSGTDWDRFLAEFSSEIGEMRKVLLRNREIEELSKKKDFCTSGVK